MEKCRNAQPIFRNCAFKRCSQELREVCDIINVRSPPSAIDHIQMAAILLLRHTQGGKGMERHLMVANTYVSYCITWQTHGELAALALANVS